MKTRTSSRNIRQPERLSYDKEGKQIEQHMQLNAEYNLHFQNITTDILRYDEFEAIVLSQLMERIHVECESESVFIQQYSLKKRISQVW